MLLLCRGGVMAGCKHLPFIWQPQACKQALVAGVIEVEGCLLLNWKPYTLLSACSGAQLLRRLLHLFHAATGISCAATMAKISNQQHAFLPGAIKATGGG